VRRDLPIILNAYCLFFFFKTLFPRNNEAMANHMKPLVRLTHASRCGSTFMLHDKTWWAAQFGQMCNDLFFIHFINFQIVLQRDLVPGLYHNLRRLSDPLRKRAAAISLLGFGGIASIRVLCEKCTEKKMVLGVFFTCQTWFSIKGYFVQLYMFVYITCLVCSSKEQYETYGLQLSGFVI
jgi:hypothetical protein